MIYKGRFRTVRHKDHAVPAPLPRPLLGQASFLDIRAWRHAGTTPLLLVMAKGFSMSMAFLAGLDALPSRPWVVWVRPARMAPPLDTIRFQDIESQLRLALRRLPASDTP